MRPFRLQSVLGYRKRLEDMAMKSLLICLQKKSQLHEEKTKAEKELHRLAENFQEAKMKGICVCDIVLYENCIQVHKENKKNISRQLDLLNSEIEIKKEELVKARQEKRALEILKERRQEQEMTKQRIKENMFLDEISIRGSGDKK